MKRRPITDQELEKYLLSFRPLAPKPLTFAKRSTLPVWRIAAFVAILVIAATLLIFLPFRRPSPSNFSYEARSIAVQSRPMVTVFQLNQAAAAGDAALESALTHQSRTILPSMDKPNSALNVLAQDSNF